LEISLIKASLADDTPYSRNAFSFDDGGIRNEVQWVPLAQFLAGETELFPTGLPRHLGPIK